MKKTNKRIWTLIPKKVLSIIALSVLTIISSCRKDDPAPTPAPVVYPEETMLSAYLTNTMFTQSVNNFINSGNYEFGVEFTPLVKGKINALKVKIPGTNTNLRITIWDAATKTVLRTENMGAVSANTEVSKTIASLDLQKDKKYAVTMNSDDWFQRRRTANTAATYPVSAGNLQVNSYKWISSTVAQQVYPTNEDLKYYAGDVDIVFQRTE